MARKNGGQAELRGMRTGAIVFLALLFACGAAVFAWYQLQHYEDNLLEIYAGQQDAYTQLVLDQINLVGGRSDEGMVRDILSSIDGSNSQYWTLSKNNALVYVKDGADTARYKGLSSESYYAADTARTFVEGLQRDRVVHGVIELDGRRFIASGVVFSYNGGEYQLCLLTSEYVVVDHNAYMLARTNLSIAILLTLFLFLTGVLLMGLRGDKWLKRARKTEKENQSLRRQLSELGSAMATGSVYDAHLGAFSMEWVPAFLKKLKAQDAWPVTLVRLTFPGEEKAASFLTSLSYIFSRDVVRFYEGTDVLLAFLKTGAVPARKALDILPEAGFRVQEVYEMTQSPEGDDALPRRLGEIWKETNGVEHADQKDP